MPGAYTEVHMNVHDGIAPMIIPVSALIFRGQGLQVGTVVKGPNGDQAKLVQVTLGQDDGSTVQVIDGLNADSQVIQNPPDSLIDGEPVHVVQPGKTGERAQRGRAGMKLRNTHLSRFCAWEFFLRPLLLSGCTVGPNYHRPTAPTAPAFKESAVRPASQPARWRMEAGDSER